LPCRGYEKENGEVALEKCSKASMATSGRLAAHFLGTEGGGVKREKERKN